MSQGDRLRILITELLESPHSFAKGIGLPTAATIYEVLNNHRPISQKLLKRIISTYPNLNPAWLLNGELPKLLTSKGHFSIVENIEEEKEVYKLACKECAKKDKEIAELRTEVMELQKQYIECLKEVSALKPASSG